MGVKRINQCSLRTNDSSLISKKLEHKSFRNGHDTPTIRSTIIGGCIKIIGKVDRLSVLGWFCNEHVQVDIKRNRFSFEEILVDSIRTTTFLSVMRKFTLQCLHFSD